MKTVKKSLVLLALLGLCLVVKSQNLECFVINPPEKPLINVEKVAILNFSNFDNNEYYRTFGGNAFVNYLTSQLLDENRGLFTILSGIFNIPKEGKTFIKSSSINTFKVIEREQLNSILREKNLSSDVELSDNQASELGKVLGVDVLLMGTIKHNYNSNRTTVRYTDGTSAFCTENTCATEIFIKVVSTTNAQIIATKTIKKTNSDKKCGNDEGKVLRFEPLAEMNLKNLALQAASFIAPSYLYYKADFRKIKEKEHKDKVSDIKKIIDNEDLGRLYTIFKAIYDADNYNADAAYNLALLHVITGDYEGAAYWDRIAYEVNPKEYGKANEWANYWEENANILKSVGVEIQKYNFDEQTDPNIFADKVKTKGKKSDRFDVFEQADATSSVQAKVPGDTEFVVLEKGATFVKIKLLGGKEGYINKENLKK